MSRPRGIIPRYRRYKKTGRAVVDVYRSDGKRTTIHLPGAYGSDESRAEYERLLTLLRANEGRLPHGRGRHGGDLTIAELVLAYMEQKVRIRYRGPDGKPTSEQLCCKRALKPLVRLYGTTLAAEFDASALEAVRASMVSGSWMTDAERAKLEKHRKPAGWCRSNVNRCVARIRTMFRWACKAPRRLVDSAQLAELLCLDPLRYGEGGRESREVQPVAEGLVEATLPHLPPVVADMVRVQLLAGCRPGELCAMRVGDLDRAGPVWVYRPARHKNQWRGHKRAVTIGPRAQLVLRKYLTDDPEAFLFSPARQAEAIKAAKRAARKTKVQPSQVDRSKADAKRLPGERFTPTAYARAIARTCARSELAHWHPNQLRHLAARQVGNEQGPEAARAFLGHKTIDMTAHYAGVDLQAATEVARKMG